MWGIGDLGSRIITKSGRTDGIWRNGSAADRGSRGATSEAWITAAKVAERAGVAVLLPVSRVQYYRVERHSAIGLCRG